MLRGIAANLRRKGVLGINERNSAFVLKYNSRSFYPRADNKILSKRLAIEAGIAVPDLFAVVSSPGQLDSVIEELKVRGDFVIKPASGSGGEGIVVLGGFDGASFLRVNGESFEVLELRRHLADTIYGLFSLGGQPDRAMVEYRVKSDPVFSDISWKGVPDIRVIVFKGVPIMSMLRLPTKISGGRANLHQGAVGAGIDMTSGITQGGVWNDKPLTSHPDSGRSIEGICIPQWNKILEMASRCFEISELGYLGVDIVIDAELGPLMLEMNARPGLAVQIANRKGLMPMLRRVEDMADKFQSTEERVAFAQRDLSRSE